MVLRDDLVVTEEAVEWDEEDVNADEWCEPEDSRDKQKSRSRATTPVMTL